MGRRKKTNAEFKTEVKDLVGSEYTFLEDYKGATTKILVRHNACGHIYSTAPNNFLRGSKCERCSFESRKKTDTEFKAEVKALVGNEYVLVSKYQRSNKKVKFKHKTCGNIFTMLPSNFLRGHRCPKCMHKKRAQGLKKTDAEFKAEVNKIIGNEYLILNQYVGRTVSILFKHSLCGTTFYMTPDVFLRGGRCPSCTKKRVRTQRTKTDSNFKLEVKNLVGKEYIVLDKYKNAITKIRFKHEKCGYIFKMRPSNFLTGNRCPKCMLEQSILKQRKTDAEFKTEVKNLVGTEYKVLGKYKGENKKIAFWHQSCGLIYYATPFGFLEGRRCPYCKTSKGELAVRKYLEARHATFIKEFKISDCRDKRPLPFDFAVFNQDKTLNCLIEYQGAQHFLNPFELNKQKGIFNTKSVLSTQKHDAIKLQYCKDHGIKLIRINHPRTEPKTNTFGYIKNIVNRTLNKELHMA